MGKQVILISCVSQKLSKRAKAKDLYVSTLFKLNLKYAQKLSPDDIFIISAKYGLLSLEQEIESYEQTLNNMPVHEVKHWANQVLQQLREHYSIDETRFVILAGKRYRKYLLPYLKNVQIPLQGLGIGRQIQKLKELVE
jgi:hypothetical protein